MRQRVSYPGYIGGFVTEADAMLAKYLACRQGCTVSELIRRWLQQEAQKPLVGSREVEHGQG
jgi:hypothetical protein